MTTYHVFYSNLETGESIFPTNDFRFTDDAFQFAGDCAYERWATDEPIAVEMVVIDIATREAVDNRTLIIPPIPKEVKR